MTLLNLDDLMRDYDGAVPGACVLLVQRKRVLIRRSFGLARVVSGDQATPFTSYRLASLSKQFTAALILLLAEEKRLSLDDYTERFFPTLPNASAITIRHLLTHTSGLTDYEDVMPAGQSGQLRDRDVLALLEREPSRYFQPGSRHRYSNGGYALLALIAEQVAGIGFASLLSQRIFDPLGMTNTIALEEGISTIFHRAFGHSRINGSFVETDQNATSAVLGDGGIYSSIDDLAHWVMAIDEGGMFDRPSLDVAFDRAVDTLEPGVGAGLGWFVGAHLGARMVWHEGDSIGFRNVIVRFPDQQLTCVILTNRGEQPPLGIALTIASAYAG